MWTGCRKAYCGDGIHNINTEECDGYDFGGRSCTSYRQGLTFISSLLGVNISKCKNICLKQDVIEAKSHALKSVNFGRFLVNFAHYSCAYWWFGWYCSPFWSEPPKKPISGAWMRFQGKRGNIESFILPKLLQRFQPNFCTTIETTKHSSWVVQIPVLQKPL